MFFQVRQLNFLDIHLIETNEWNKIDHIQEETIDHILCWDLSGISPSRYSSACGTNKSYIKHLYSTRLCLHCPKYLKKKK